MTVVDGIDVMAFRIALDAPESDGTLTWSDTTVVVVEARADGRCGLGFTYAPVAVASLIRDHLAPVVVGAPADPPARWQSMVGAVRNYGRSGLSSCAIAAVDTALWDLHARLLDQPLACALGLVRNAVPIYGSGGFTSLADDQLVDQFTTWVHDVGIPRVKMKVGTAWGTEELRDLERVELARKCIGDSAALFVDANGAYGRKQAIRLAHRFRDFGVSWFEEPVSSDDLDGLQSIRERVDIEVAAGEYGYHLVYFERMLHARAVDCLQADVSRCAGITEWLRVAAVAAAHGVDVSGHCAPSLHAHPACAVPNLRHVEYFADHVRADALLFDGVLEPQPGGVLRPDLSRPGCGLSLRNDAEHFRVA